MGKQASVPHSSTIQLKLWLLLLILFAPAAVVGCRGPWFKKTSDFDPLVVSEQPEARNPREFIASRSRSTTPSQTKTTTTGPKDKSRVSSDDSSDIVADDELPSEHQELFSKQLQAIENMRPSALKDLIAADDKEDEGSASFSMSDEGETKLIEKPAAKPPVTAQKKAPPAREKSVTGSKRSDRPASPPDADVNAAHPLSREGGRLAAEKAQAKVPDQPGPIPPIQPALKTAEDQAPPADLKAQAAPADSPVARANAIAAVADTAISAAKTSITIETPKTDWRVLVQEAQAAMQAEADSAVALSPNEKFAMALKQRLLSLTVDDLEAAMEPIEGLQTHEQEFFQNEFQALHATADPRGSPVLNRRWTLALQSHRKAQMHLAAVSNLEIQNAAFCTEVDSFGIISKFPKYHFRSDQELLLYCEIDNFLSEPVKDGFETKLQGSYEIVDSNNRRVTDQLLPPDEHVCRNQRRDYFIAYRLFTPQDLQPGRYTLKLTIEDMKAHKFGQAAVDFQIVQ